MTSIAAARKASTAARASRAEATGAQLSLDLAQSNIKSFDAQAKSLRTSLNAELQKSPPNPATVTALRNGIASFEALRDAEKAKLPALREAVNASTKKLSEASATAFTEERKVLDAKAKLETDQFEAKSAAGGKRLAGRAIDAGADTLDALEKALKAELRKPGITTERKRELKKAIAALDRGEAAMRGQERKLERSARKDDAAAKRLGEKLDDLAPVAAEAQRLLGEDATGFVTHVAGSVTTHVKAAVTEAEEKANGAGSTAQLDGVLSSKNADRAMNAWERIDAVANGSPDAKGRLTPQVRDALVQGVALSRTADKHGQEGILSQHQAVQAAEALAKMPKGRYDEIMKLLDQAGGATGDAQTERALILKAVAVRGEALVSDSAYKRPAALYELASVKSFAHEIRGEQRDALIRSTSPIDLDASKNESLVRPEDFRGLQNPMGDPYNNNDGRFQKFDTTCVPTSGQIVKEEADPIAARRMSKDPVFQNDATSAAALEQKAILSADGGKTSTRRAKQAYERAMEIGKGTLKLNGLEQAVLSAALRGDSVDLFGISGSALLKRVQAADAGMPGANELGWMKSELSLKNDGMGVQKGLNQVASRTIGYDYRELGVGGSTTATWNTTDPKTSVVTTHSKTMGVPNLADFAVWDTALKEGHDVPLRIGNSGDGGHAIVVTDVRGTHPNREYLVADPWSGATNWITQNEMTQGVGADGRSWIQARFGLGWDRITDFYVK